VVNWLLSHFTNRWSLEFHLLKESGAFVMSGKGTPMRRREQALPLPRPSPRILAVLNGDEYDPFSFLGMHKDARTGELIVRAFLPEAEGVAVVDRGSGEVIAELMREHDAGLFTGVVAKNSDLFPYRLRVTDGGPTG
jgi:hypothetical protein